MVNFEIFEKSWVCGTQNILKPEPEPVSPTNEDSAFGRHKSFWTFWVCPRAFGAPPASIIKMFWAPETHDFSKISKFTKKLPKNYTQFSKLPKIYTKITVSVPIAPRSGANRIVFVIFV